LPTIETTISADQPNSPVIDLGRERKKIRIYARCLFGCNLGISCSADGEGKFAPVSASFDKDNHSKIINIQSARFIMLTCRPTRAPKDIVVLIDEV